MTDQKNAAVRVELSASTRRVRLPRQTFGIIRAHLRAYLAMNAVVYRLFAVSVVVALAFPTDPARTSAGENGFNDWIAALMELVALRPGRALTPILDKRNPATAREARGSTIMARKTYSEEFRRRTVELWGDALVNRLQFVADNRHALEGKGLCTVLQVCRSSSYGWLAAAPARAAADTAST